MDPSPTAINHQVRLAARPSGLPKPTDWNATTEPVPSPGDGEFVVRLLYLSLDPAMRGWMNDSRSYAPPVGIGEVMRAGAAGRVVASRHPRFAVGDAVVGMFGVQEYALSAGRGVRRIEPSQAVPLPVFLGALGMPGPAFVGPCQWPCGHPAYARAQSVTVANSRPQSAPVQ
jgi:NADPH-dependent curcumin reductase CurA